MRRTAPASKLAPTLLLGLVWLAAAPASAQSQGLVARDGTLGSGPLEVGPGIDPLGQPATYLITPEMGEQRGSNLFHSFERFGIGTNETATFTGPDPIGGPQSVSNVISRVTGGNESRIEGTLRSTIPGADVWLLNPSGVVFGQGAQLDVEGSFHASTADSLGFGTDGLERFYSDSSRPSVLSTATPLAFGFLGESGAALLAVERSALEVPDGETLELAGGDVSLALNAALVAPGGSVQIEAQDGVLISQSLVDVGRAEATPGTISIRGGKIVVEKSSLVRAENESGVPTADATQPGPGSISLAASESVLVDASLLSVSTHAAGNAGTIDIASPEITLRNGLGFDPLAPPQESRAGVRAETTSSGRGGEIQMQAEDLVTLANGIGVSASAVGPGVSGDAGTVKIAARKVELTRDSYVSADTAGDGNGGTISIEAGESIEVTDGSILSAQTIGAVDADGVLEAASGSGGEIVLRAGSVRIANRGLLSVDSIGSSGDAGVIDITADSLTVDALDPQTGTETFAGMGANSRAAPDLWIGQQQPSVPLTPARAGTIVIKAGSIEFKNGGGILSTCVRCMGGAGEIWISADEMSVDGAIFAHTGLGSSGAGGYIQIDAGSLVTESRWISTETRGEGTSGNAGDIVIHAGSLTVHGAILAYTWDGSSGNAGTIAIDAGSLMIEGGSISVNTFNGSSGNAGGIEIDTRSLTLRSGGGVDAQAFGAGAGNAGTITVVADTIEIDDEAGIRASSRGGGTAGEIHLTAKDWIRLEDAGVEPFSLRAALTDADFFTGVFSTTVGGGDSRSITLQAPEITISKGAFIATSTVGGGDAGDIFLSADRIRIEDGAFVDSTSLPFDVSGSGQLVLPGGKAGSVTLEASESIEVIGRHPADGAASRVASGTLNASDAGEVSLTAPRIVLDGGAVSTGAVPFSVGPSGGAGGSITLNAGRDLLVSNGGQVTASTLGSGDAGRIDIQAGESIRVEGAGSTIVSRTGANGIGGDVELRAPRIEIASGGEISARSEAGLGETSAVVASLEREGLLAALPDTAEGNAGSIELVADSVLLDGGTIATNADAADGGNVDILAKQLLHLDRGVITATVTDDTGGNITIDPEVVLLENGSRIEARAGGGTGGSIQITADNYFAFPGSVVSADSELGIDGIVAVHAPDVDLAGNLTVLPTDYLDASSLMRERCAARSGEPSGSFAVRGNGGIPPEPDGWLRASVLSDAETTASAALPPIHVASLAGPLLARGTCE